MAIELGGDVLVAPPVLPSITTGPPVAEDVIAVPVAGPRGPAGVPGTSDGDTIQTLIDDSIAEHRVEPEPHTAYDDIQSLVLLFENRLV